MLMPWLLVFVTVSMFARPATRLKIQPGYARAFNNRGAAYQKKHQYERAMQDFEQSIKIDPKYAGAFANRAQVYQNMGQYDRAVRDYDEAIRLQPDLESVWNGRCWAGGLAYSQLILLI